MKKKKMFLATLSTFLMLGVFAPAAEAFFDTGIQAWGGSFRAGTTVASNANIRVDLRAGSRTNHATDTNGTSVSTSLIFGSDTTAISTHNNFSTRQTATHSINR